MCSLHEDIATRPHFGPCHSQPASLASNVASCAFIRPVILIGQDDGLDCLVQFQNMMQCAYNNTERTGVTFTSLRDQMEKAPGKDLDGLPDMAKAATVAGWVRATRPPKEVATFVDLDFASSEIARRALPSAADRFRPLFEAKWRTGYAALSDLWPEEMDGATAAEMAAALAASLDIRTGGEALIGPAALALNALVGTLLPVMEQKASNAERTEALRAAHRKAQRSDTDGEKMTLDAEGELNRELRLDWRGVSAPVRAVACWCCCMLVRWPGTISREPTMHGNL